VNDRHLTVVGSQPGGVARRILFERAHPEVAIVPPAGLSDRWRAIVSPGKIPGKPTETTIGSYGLGGLRARGPPASPAPGTAPGLDSVPDRRRTGPAAGERQRRAGTRASRDPARATSPGKSIIAAT